MLGAPSVANVHELERYLKLYLDKAATEPMVWGESDCSSWVAGWVTQITGVPLALPRYSSREEAHALIREAGSLSELWERCLVSSDLLATEYPVRGSIGIVISHLHGQAGGIFVSEDLFAWRTEPAGFRLLRPRRKTLVKAWSFL